MSRWSSADGPRARIDRAHMGLQQPLATLRLVDRRDTIGRELRREFRRDARGIAPDKAHAPTSLKNSSTRELKSAARSKWPEWPAFGSGRTRAPGMAASMACGE